MLHKLQKKPIVLHHINMVSIQANRSIKIVCVKKQKLLYNGQCSSHYIYISLQFQSYIPITTNNDRLVKKSPVCIIKLISLIKIFHLVCLSIQEKIKITLHDDEKFNQQVELILPFYCNWKVFVLTQILYQTNRLGI